LRHFLRSCEQTNGSKVVDTAFERNEMVIAMAATTCRSCRVLVVEDEFLLRDMIVDVLREDGFEVCAVESAMEGLRYLASGEPCDALFTDIDLRDGPDGGLLAKLARQMRPQLAVVYASGAVAGLEQLSAVPGAIFLRKPYRPEMLGATLRRVITSARSTAGNPVEFNPRREERPSTARASVYDSSHR
jgi:CheY-like chemotaxis protein